MVERRNRACLRGPQRPVARQPDVTGRPCVIHASPSGLSPAEALSASGILSLHIYAQPVLTVLLSALGYGVTWKLLMVAAAP